MIPPGHGPEMTKRRHSGPVGCHDPRSTHADHIVQVHQVGPRVPDDTPQLECRTPQRRESAQVKACRMHGPFAHGRTLQPSSPSAPPQPRDDATTSPLLGVPGNRIIADSDDINVQLGKARSIAIAATEHDVWLVAVAAQPFHQVIEAYHRATHRRGQIYIQDPMWAEHASCAFRLPYRLLARRFTEGSQEFEKEREDKSCQDTDSRTHHQELDELGWHGRVWFSRWLDDLYVAQLLGL